VAFAAPLLRASELQNFSLHVFGRSRGGKTTALLCAMSVFGLGREEHLPNWNATGARLLEAAAGFCDVVFPLNEVGAAKGKRKQTYEGLRDLYAQFAEGSDRDRHSSFQGEAMRFCGICMATAEHSVAKYAAMADEFRDDGELFRAIDVAAFREGAKTILDLAPETIDQRKRLSTLRSDLKTFHGTAFAPYLEHLDQMGPGEVKRRVHELIAEFVGHMPAAAHDGVASQMAMNFGLLYAGATLAIEAGILPWTKDHLRRCLKRSFDDAFDRSKPIDPLILGLDILKANLRERVVERKPDSKFGVKDHPGYSTRMGGEKLMVVHTPQFGSWFSSKTQRNIVLEWLAEKGALRSGHSTVIRAVTPEVLNGVLRSWPDKSLVRSFEFTDPFPEAVVAAPRKSLRRLKLTKLGKGGENQSAGPAHRQSTREESTASKFIKIAQVKGVKARLARPAPYPMTPKKATLTKVVQSGQGSKVKAEPAKAAPRPATREKARVGKGDPNKGRKAKFAKVAKAALARYRSKRHK
jgi:hypothetical protein